MTAVAEAVRRSLLSCQSLLYAGGDPFKDHGALRRVRNLRAGGCGDEWLGAGCM
ncbi:hypothetical protein OG369_04365 [Streptomyces sp. NBC_01221]|nr:hypothetical protein [Streptomyces sp. NBC_01221]